MVTLNTLLTEIKVKRELSLEPDRARSNLYQHYDTGPLTVWMKVGFMLMDHRVTRSNTENRNR